MPDTRSYGRSAADEPSVKAAACSGYLFFVTDDPDRLSIGELSRVLRAHSSPAGQRQGGAHSSHSLVGTCGWFLSFLGRQPVPCA